MLLISNRDIVATNTKKNKVCEKVFNNQQKKISLLMTYKLQYFKVSQIYIYFQMLADFHMRYFGVYNSCILISNIFKPDYIHFYH